MEFPRLLYRAHPAEPGAPPSMSYAAADTVEALNALVADGWHQRRADALAALAPAEAAAMVPSAFEPTPETFAPVRRRKARA